MWNDPKYNFAPIPDRCTRVINSDGGVFDIPIDHPDVEKLVNFAKDTECQRKMKMIGIKDPQKQCDAYLKYHQVQNAKPKTAFSLSEQERVALEAKPDRNGLGIGKSGEALNEVVNRFHREPEPDYPDSHKINIPLPLKKGG